MEGLDDQIKHLESQLESDFYSGVETLYYKKLSLLKVLYMTI